MKIYYIIEHPFNGGYWSEEHNNWKGFLFATNYSTIDAAKDRINNSISVACKISIIYKSQP